jgi:membrane protein YdbS with pleckstrin-like domain
MRASPPDPAPHGTLVRNVDRWIVVSIVVILASIGAVVLYGGATKPLLLATMAGVCSLLAALVTRIFVNVFMLPWRK